MKATLRIFLMLTLSLMMGACEIPLGSDDDAALAENNQAITTSAAQYEWFVEDDARWIDTDIPNTFTNPLTVPVYFYGCRPPNQGVLEFKNGDVWEAAYDPVYPACLSPAFRVLPGESVELPSGHAACLPYPNCGQDFRGPLVGTYRLRYSIFFSDQGTDLIPESYRLSNTFELSFPAN